jgi:hypothetical protein
MEGVEMIREIFGKQIKVFQFFGSRPGGPNQNERRQRQLTGTTLSFFNNRRHNGEEITRLLLGNSGKPVTLETSGVMKFVK